MSVVIVTGASRGLGRGIAVELGRRGAHLVLAARDVERLEETRALVQAAGARGLVVPTDVASSASVDELIARTCDEFGCVDALVNNAGIAPQLPVTDMTDDDWESVMAVNLDSTFYAARSAGSVFRRQGHGRIVNIGSVFGLRGRSGFAAYGASKAAVSHLTRVLAVEWARHGIQVNAVAPGYISTDINVEMRNDDVLRSRIVGRIPARRLGEAHEVANLVTYLALDAPNFLTGQVIAIDGGESST